MSTSEVCLEEQSSVEGCNVLSKSSPEIVVSLRYKGQALAKQIGLCWRKFNGAEVDNRFA
jgi:hypothetical protein